MKKRCIAFGRWCVSKLGGFLKHPLVVRVLIQVAAWLLLWVLKILIIALLTTAGPALLVG
jgi:hypothetical protein